MTHDLRFDEAVVNTSYRDLTSRIVSEPLAGVIAAYVNNLDRLVALLKTPGALYQFSCHTDMATRLSAYKIYGTADILITDPKRPFDDPAFLREQTQWIASRLPQIIKRLDNTDTTEWKKISAFIDTLLPPLQGTDLPAGLESIFSASILGAWTAFEVLSADLWEACVNARPRLGFIAPDADSSDSDDDETSERKSRTKFSLPIWQLKAWDYNVKTHMGSAVKGKWDFANRNEAKKAYLKVFKEDEQKLKSLFQAQSLKWLAAVRNVIVHKAGIADAEFTTLVRDHPTLKLVAAGTPIVIDGVLVRELIDPSIKYGTELIEFVSGWLTSHEG